MIQRLALVAALVVGLIGSPVLTASSQRGSSKGSSHKSGSPKSGSSKGGSSKGSSTKTSTSSGDKTVHVKGYYRKDGTYVEGHERRAPGTATQTTRSSGNDSPSTYSSTQPRDSHGRFVRSEAARDAFMRQTGYPHGRPGYVVDHIVPLACGGADSPSNMQWQTMGEAKAKDKIELKGCR